MSTLIKFYHLRSYEATLRKILKSKAPKTDPCGTPEISSNKVLYTLLIGTHCFLFLRYEKINQSDYLSKP